MKPLQRLASVVLLFALISLGCESEPASRPAGNRKTSDPAKVPAKKEDKPAMPRTSEPGRETSSTTEPAQTTEPGEPPVQVAKKEPPKDPPKFDDWARTKLGDSLWLETQGEKKEKRRVLVGTLVCLRKGNYGLECLLCRKGTKEHESILVTTADARIIHSALEVAGAKAGAPVQYEPEFKSPHGDKIKVTAVFEQNGKLVTMPAQKWITNQKTKKELEHPWVFAGSRLYKNLDDVNLPPRYAANDEGGYICISNVPTALLDLPIQSPKAIDDRIFEPNTQNIPPLDAFVTLILEK